MQLHEKISGLTDQQSSASSALQQSIEQMQVTVKMRETERGIVEKENLQLASLLREHKQNYDVVSSKLLTAERDIIQKNQLIDRLSTEAATVNDQLATTEALYASVQLQCKELLQEKTNLADAIISIEQDSKQEISRLQTTIATLTSVQNEIVSDNEKLKDLINNYNKEKEKELSNFKHQIHDLESANEQFLTATRNLKTEILNLTTELNSERSQTIERRDKIKQKFTELTNEKTALLKLNEEYAHNKKVLEEQLNRLEFNLDVKRQEKDDLDKDYKHRILSLEKEMQSLHSTINQLHQHKQEEVDDITQKMLCNNKELEEHKSKRMAARNEMVQLAGTLEKVQHDYDSLKQFLMVTISPLLLDYHSSIEQLITNLDNIIVSLVLNSKHTFHPLKHINSGLRANGIHNSNSSDSTDGSNDVVINSIHGNSIRKRNSAYGVDVAEVVDKVNLEITRLGGGLILLNQGLEKLVCNIQESRNGGCCSTLWQMFNIKSANIDGNRRRSETSEDSSSGMIMSRSLGNRKGYTMVNYDNNPNNLTPPPVNAGGHVSNVFSIGDEE
jgi:chromosome segregation ATPase